MTDTEARVGLQSQIESWWRSSVADLKRFRDNACPTVSTAVSERDAASFLRGVRQGWIRVDHPNQFRSTFFGEHGPTGFTFFEGGNGKRARMRDETFAHYAAATELVCDYGWRVEQVVSEPTDPEKLVTAGALDLLVFASADGGSPVFGVEAKGDLKKLTSLIDGINSCSGHFGPGHPKDEHNKCLALRRFRLDYLWAVACGVRELFHVKHSETTLLLTPERDVLSASNWSTR